LATVILDLRLVDWQYLVGILPRVGKVHAIGSPHKILKQFVRVLLLDNQTSCIDNVAAVLNELTTLRGKLALIHGGVVEDISEGRVDLLIGGITPLAASLYDAVESELKETEYQRKKIKYETAAVPCGPHQRPSPAY